jgi:hypothetical protein
MLRSMLGMLTKYVTKRKIERAWGDSSKKSRNADIIRQTNVGHEIGWAVAVIFVAPGPP